MDDDFLSALFVKGNVLVLIYIEKRGERFQQAMVTNYIRSLIKEDC
jgi:hypothetical protein